nr:hypothetical protein CFP56_03770 [Quercus suber]
MHQLGDRRSNAPGKVVLPQSYYHRYIPSLDDIVDGRYDTREHQFDGLYCICLLLELHDGFSITCPRISDLDTSTSVPCRKTLTAQTTSLGCSADENPKSHHVNDISQGASTLLSLEP